MKFSKDKFLKDGIDMFVEMANKEDEYFDATEVLGIVINYFYGIYDNEDIINNTNYDIDYIENSYEIAEGSEEDYCDGIMIKNYRDALAYYSLNDLFVTNYNDKIDELFPM